MNEQKLLLTCRAAARALGVSVNTVTKWRRTRGLPFVMIDNRVMYPRQKLAEWLDSRVEQKETAAT